MQATSVFYKKEPIITQYRLNEIKNWSMIYSSFKQKKTKIPNNALSI
jgi:hypothetical protein